MRLVDLGMTRGVWLDEALNGLEGIAAVQQHDFKLFYPDIGGREGLFINAVGISEAIFGVNEFALRLPAAIAGALTVVFIFLLARRLFCARMALIAAWFAATGFWHLDFSRMSFRAILAPLFLTASLYFFFRASDEPAANATGKRHALISAAVGGLLFGLGFHSYIAFRIAPLLAAFVFAGEMARKRSVETGHAPSLRQEPPRSPALRSVISLQIIALWLVAAIVTSLPMALYFARHPQQFLQRAQAVSVFQAPHPARTLASVALHTAAMFNLRGDCNWRHNLECSPELVWPVGIFFLLGAAVALRNWIRHGRGARGEALLLLWLGIMLIPEMLSADAIPHAMRALAAAPAAYMLAALGAEMALAALGERRRLAALLLAALVATGGYDLYRYFGEWAHSPALLAANAFSQHEARIGELLNALPAATPRIVVLPGAPYANDPTYPRPALDMRAQPIAFATYGHPQPRYLFFHDLLRAGDDVRALLPRGSVVVPLDPDISLMQLLIARGVRAHPVGANGVLGLEIE